jgi:hypothetical protein
MTPRREMITRDLDAVAPICLSTLYAVTKACANARDNTRLFQWREQCEDKG